MICVIDKTIGYIFTCETEEGAKDLEAAIELLGHDSKILRPKKESIEI